MSDEHNQARSIFLAAIEKYPPEQWSAFLQEACGGDDVLRSQVEKLLKAHAQLGSFHEDQENNLPGTLDQPSTEQAGSMIGPYKLLEPIGEGGMGIVYMAEQQEPLRRMVALKLIKPGMDSRQVLARFEAERQALALMDHPNIAKVHDGGATPDGRPYFVMELVKGTPITKYCDDKKLSVRERLELFGEVCRAVQHAHQKGIIHRDLKPSNVLVAPYDGKPVVKVIDFGVAKAMGQKLTESTLFTGFGAVVGTPEYMSPEQAEMNNADIDTRSDIYSLGVVLYELLTGSTPLVRKQLREASFSEILRMIREEEPPKPSTRLLESSDTLPSVSAHRNLEPEKLTRMIQGDLDWIAMKALDKDRSRRYETANAFASDIDCYLKDEPVSACPPSSWNRLKKFARRNRSMVISGFVIGAAFLITMASLGWSTFWALEMNSQKEEALKKAEEQYRQALENKDKAIKEGQRADSNFRQAIDEVGELLRLTNTSKLQNSDFNLLRKAQAKRAIPFFQKMLEQKRTDQEGRRQNGLAYIGLAQALEAGEEILEAADAYGNALGVFRGLARNFPDSQEFAKQVDRVRGSFAILMGSGVRKADRLSISNMRRQAIKSYNEVVLMYEKYGHEMKDPATAGLAAGHSANNLARLLRLEGQNKEAFEMASKAHAIWTNIQKGSPRNIWLPFCKVSDCQSLFLLGLIQIGAGRLDEAETDFRLLFSTLDKLPPDERTAVLGMDLIDLSDIHEAFGFTLWRNSKQSEATKQFGFAQEKRKTQPKGAYRDNRTALFFSTCSDKSFRNPKEAMVLASTAVKLKPEIADYWTTLGIASYRVGNWKAAIEALEKAGKAPQSEWEPRLYQDSRINYLFLAMAHWKIGNQSLANKWYQKVALEMEKWDPRNPVLGEYRFEAENLLGITTPPSRKKI